MKNKLTKILETVGYLLAIGFGFTILYFGFQMLETAFKAIFK
jgi:TRAP-type C4-dicarboxylate transport system permease small subunit